jgi:hypothetical protein
VVFLENLFACRVAQQGQAIFVNTLQPNLNPRYRDFHRDNAPSHGHNIPTHSAAATNGLGPGPGGGGPKAPSPTNHGQSFSMPPPPPKKTIDVIGGSTGTSRRSLEIDETKAIQVRNNQNQL